MGLFLRYIAIADVGVNYRFLTHAHSHVAMLGWVYLMLYVFIVHYFVPEKKPIFNTLFWLTEIAVLGMVLSFPFQGYATVSISFSTLHILCSYYFVFLVWKYQKTNNKASEILLKTALVFMLLSTVGVWCLGPAVSMQGKASAFYQIAIQFFLHFQFNGWFLMAVFALLFYVLQIPYSKSFKNFFILLVLATVCTLALPINWYAPSPLLLWINGVGAIVQLAALILFFKLIKFKVNTFLNNDNALIKWLYYFAISCLILKIGLQTLSVIPEVSQIALRYHNFIIGFIHLLMLGVISGFLFLFILNKNWTSLNRVLSLGIISFVLGFIFTEILLFVQGFMYFLKQGILPNYYNLLFLASIFLPLGILLITINILNHGKEKKAIKTT